MSNVPKFDKLSLKNFKNRGESAVVVVELEAPGLAPEGPCALLAVGGCGGEGEVVGVRWWGWCGVVRVVWCS